MHSERCSARFGSSDGGISIIEGKRRKLLLETQAEGGIKVIREKYLSLTREIGSGPEYFIHSGESKGRALIVKVFNRTADARKRLEATVELTKGLLHPNILRIEGISSEASSTQFIAYKHVHWMNAEGPLAAALKSDLTRSVNLGFKMVGGLSAGINHLHVQGISLEAMNASNFDVFLDVDDRFVMSINSSPLRDVNPSVRDTSSNRSWDIFNDLCRQVLSAANRVLHSELDRERFVSGYLTNREEEHNIERSPVDISPQPMPYPSSPPFLSPDSTVLESKTSTSSDSPSPPRREYVWRQISKENKSLAAVAAEIEFDLALNSLSLKRMALVDKYNVHRCAGYVREEITLASSLADSAVVTHDTPSPTEICPICCQAVGCNEKFSCRCGNRDPGCHPTIKCQHCKSNWSHVHCVGSSQPIICHFCSLVLSLAAAARSSKEPNFGLGRWTTAASASSETDDDTYASAAHFAHIQCKNNERLAGVPYWECRNWECRRTGRHLLTIS
ncbi:hypothetical protein R3P38DRAFT_2710462 [Favolaschia claudopus]|uniref:Protein kinase domain-containing protein n=1 Tax=Favolaschia claudopus TaxID=2862362 RepID=A0AAW0BCB2_9AGAR